MTKNRKIAFYIEDGRFAGPHKYTFEITKEFKSRGYDVIVIAPQFESDYFVQKLKDEQIPYILLPLNRLTKQKNLLLKYIFGFFIELFLISKIIKKYNIDIFNIVGGVWQFKGVCAAIFTSSKVVWRLNDTSMPKVFKYIFQILSPHVDAIIVNGSKVEEYYLDSNIDKKKVYNIQSPVDTNYYNPESCEEKQNDRIVISTIGNVNPLKGFEYFIDMANEVSLHYPNIEFYIAGKLNESQKEYIGKLNSLINRSNAKINLLGMVEDTKSLLYQTDIYVCSSISEASPIAVWEAMSMGKIIVSTNVGDVSNIIKDNVDGFIVNICDTKMMASKILNVLDDFKRYEFIKINARLKAEDLLSVKVISNQHFEAYNMLCH